MLNLIGIMKEAYDKAMSTWNKTKIMTFLVGV